MSKPFSNPFFEADMSKMFDMSKMTGMTSDFRIPQFDMEAAFALQRKNIEAFTALSQAAYESWQSLWHRQTDTLRQIIEEASQTAQSIAASPTPEDKAMKQAEASRSAIDKCLANVRDISETVAKCNAQALDTVSSRMSEGLNEWRGVMKSGRSA